MNNDDIEILDMNDEPSKVEQDIEIIDDLDFNDIDVDIIDVESEIISGGTNNKNQTLPLENENNLNDIVFAKANSSALGTSEVNKKTKLNLTPIIGGLVIVCIIAIIFIIFKLITGGTQNNTEKLRQISLRMQTGSTIISLKETYGIEVSSTKDGITVSLTSNNNSSSINKKYEYKLQKNILALEDIDSDDLLATSISTELMDAVAQINGYQKDELKDYIMSVADYSVFKLKNGIEWSSKKDLITIKVNINKKYPIPDNIDYSIGDSELNNEYFKEEDYYSYNNSKLKFYKIVEDSKTLIYIYEKNTITENSYKTMINVIGILYPDLLNTFKNQFQEIKEKEYDKFNLVLNPKIDDTELEEEDLNNYVGFKLEINQES